jgi:hypothetical protein
MMICAKGWIDFDGEIAVMVGYVLRYPVTVLLGVFGSEMFLFSKTGQVWLHEITPCPHEYRTFIR